MEETGLEDGYARLEDGYAGLENGYQLVEKDRERPGRRLSAGLALYTFLGEV